MGSVAGTAAGIVGGLVAGITLKYTYDKYIQEQQMHKKIKSLPRKVFRRGPAPVTVRAVYPDHQTFSHNMKSPIWVEFDAPIDSSTVTKDTVIVKSSVSVKNQHTVSKSPTTNSASSLLFSVEVMRVSAREARQPSLSNANSSALSLSSKTKTSRNS